MIEVRIYGRKEGILYGQLACELERVREDVQQAIAGIPELALHALEVVVRYIGEEAVMSVPIYVEIVLERDPARTSEVLEQMDKAVEEVLVDAMPNRQVYCRHILVEPRLQT